MKKIYFGALFAACLFLTHIPVQAADDALTIKAGVYADSVNLSGMTQDEAQAAVTAYVNGYRDAKISLIVTDDQQLDITAGDLNLTWGNPSIIQEAVRLGDEGNVIERYKALKDLEHDRYVYDVEFVFDINALDRIIGACGERFNQAAVDATLSRENGEFLVVPGQTGYKLDVEASIDAVYGYLLDEWEGEDCRIQLAVEVEEPRGKTEELLQVKDLLGTYTTSFKNSGHDRSENVVNGCALVDGATVYPGEEFSTYQAVSPFTEANGYYMAGSYLNGKVVDSLGGGICQVSTTLYNAVLLSELNVTERHNHSMSVTYVEPSADAAIAESAGKDFRFVNNTDYPIYIEGYTVDKKITFNIYGKETRDRENRQVTYESKVLEVIRPEGDQITADAGQPIGYVASDGAHTGYKAELWKVVTENGVEVSRERINSSSYKMVPRSATVGVATDNPAAYNEIMAAIGTGDLDHVKSVIAILTTPAAEPAPAPVPEAAAQ